MSSHSDWSFHFLPSVRTYSGHLLIETVFCCCHNRSLFILCIFEHPVLEFRRGGGLFFGWKIAYNCMLTCISLFDLPTGGIFWYSIVQPYGFTKFSKSQITFSALVGGGGGGLLMVLELACTVTFLPGFPAFSFWVGVVVGCSWAPLFAFSPATIFPGHGFAF